ncbi:hypothetical protein [Pararhodospirillum photometricum]|uniref:hypothetical protein n=1 Tax=Pararhodospirillum photometricum TaxID=1084 RepID=UPI0012FE8840|nr:hypothetical protein [Pararhodospirillum photometricum]
MTTLDQNGERHAIGLVFAGTVPDVSYILPLRPILERFGVSLRAPAGTVTIARHPTPRGDEIVVFLAPGTRLPLERMPSVFRGVPVRYETRRSAKALG